MIRRPRCLTIGIPWPCDQFDPAPAGVPGSSDQSEAPASGKGVQGGGSGGTLRVMKVRTLVALLVALAAVVAVRVWLPRLGRSLDPTSDQGPEATGPRLSAEQVARVASMIRRRQT